jgi:hypothetical protein
MAQTSFALDDTQLADPQVGFDIGWDHARHGLPPPPEQWLDGNPLHQGWRAGKACFGERTLGASRRVRLWLALRLHAWLCNRAFEPTEVTPHYLGQIEVGICPVTRRALVQAETSVDRVNNQAGYAAGNLAMLSVQANRAKGTLGWDEALRQAQRADSAEGGQLDGLDAAAWARLAVLISFVTPLPHEQAAKLPLRVLPPNRLRLLNPVQGLQALVTRELGRPDGTRRLRELAALLPLEAQRLDFHRFLSAMLPRRLEAGRDADAWTLRHALEDAWCDARVNRCWQRFALQLDAALIERLLQRCAAGALSGMHLLLHELARATEGWALDRGGWAEATGRAGLRVLPRPSPGPQADRARISASRARTADGHLPA